LPVDHTANNIAEALKDVQRTWKLPENRQISITTDNGANMICIANILEWQRLSCFGHNLNLAVTNSIKNDQRVTRALGVAHGIVSAFSTSWKRRREMIKVQIEKKLPQHTLIVNCPTRWGSMAKMITRLLEQEEAIRTVLGASRDTSHLLPTWQDIHVWESLAEALSPLEDLTDFLSGDSHITISSVIPVLYNLATKVLKVKEDDSTLAKNIKQHVISYMEEKYTDSKTKEILNIATFLDPRFKVDFVEGDDLETLDDNIINEGMEILSAAGSSDAAESHSQQSSSTTSMEPATKKRKLSTFLKKDSTITTTTISIPLQKLQKEVEAYKSSPKLEIDSDETPMRWWKHHSTVYPILSQLSKKYLCICATSCTSERQFSTSGNIVTSYRASLKPNKVNMLVFLAQNL